MQTGASRKNRKASSDERGGTRGPRKLEGLPVRELIALLEDVDERAWQHLWELYAPMSLGLIRHLIGARNWFALKGWEDDLLVESFERLLGGITKFRGDTYGQLEGFVRANVAFTCLQKLRAVKRWPTGELTEATVSDDPDDNEDIVECEQILHGAIEALPPELAAIVNMNIVGYSSLEVAAKLGLPRQTVFDRKHRALGLLHEHLDREHFWEECAAYISLIRLKPAEGAA